MPKEFGLLQYATRWMISMLIVLGTYNPYLMSYYHWILEDGGGAALKVLAGVALVILHVVAVLATVRSLGPVGIGLLTAFFASTSWFLSDQGLIAIEDPNVLVFTLLVILATVYSIGFSWSHLRNRISGQVDSRDITQASPI